MARRRGMSAEHIGRLLAQGCARLAQAELGKDQAGAEGDEGEGRGRVSVLAWGLRGKKNKNKGWYGEG